MRYAIFTDVHANLEALEAVLAEIDALSKEEPIDQIWFLGDLVGYGPNPNECITLLRKRTDVIIAGNHDWAAVGKIDLEEFSAAARVSAEWTMQQLTEEHRAFLANLPERLEIGECTLVHGSPFGPLWEYLTSEALAERSFQHFSSRLCFVGHTHVPVIFQQPDSIANAPTLPLEGNEQNGQIHTASDSEATTQETAVPESDTVVEVTGTSETADIIDTTDAAGTPDMAMVSSSIAHTAKVAAQAESAYADPATGQPVSEDDANMLLEKHVADTRPAVSSLTVEENMAEDDTVLSDDETAHAETVSDVPASGEEITGSDTVITVDADELSDTEIENESNDVLANEEAAQEADETANSIESLNNEIEELLELLGLSESMITVTNEMLTPPEGHWNVPDEYRAIINPGGVGQPRDGDARAAFMIYDTEHGFTFYRIPYNLHKTQEKILKAGLPQYLAIRLAYGR